MITPLEQIKERLEKMKKNPPQDACYQSWTPQEVVDANIYDSAISDIQAILPSIIQEVVEETKKEDARVISFEIEKYFNNLLVIPRPDLTKDVLKQVLLASLKENKV